MERHWFSHSKTSVPNKLCLLCLLMSLRCTCSFSRPSTADVLSLRPYAHTTNNLGSRIPSIAPVCTHIFSRYGYQMDCKPQPHSLTASGSCASVSRCSVFKVQRRWATYHPFGGAHRYDTGETLAGEVLLDLCTYDNMNIKSCQKVTES